MNQVEKKVCKLKSMASFIEFGPNYDGFELSKIQKELNELEPYREGYYVKLTHKDENSIYLTEDSVLCISLNDPTYFESVKEAISYLSKAELSLDDYTVEIKYRGKKNN